MSENTAATAEAVDWNAVATADAPASAAVAQRAAAPAAPSYTLPELPLVVGRLPIKADTKIAVLRLPDPIKGVACAFTVANVSVLADCYVPPVDTCRQGVVHSRPLNDREIEVVLTGNGEGKVVGPGWKTSGVPGGQLETRPIEFGQPFVEVLVVGGRLITCGCDPDKWATSEWGA